MPLVMPVYRTSLLFVAVVVVQHASGQQCEGGGKCSTAKRIPTSSPMLMQLAARSSKAPAEKDLDAAVARHIKNFSADPQNIAAVVTKGINGVLQAVAHFSAVPPRIDQGVTALGHALHGCVRLVLPADKQSGEKWENFSKAWTASFQTVSNSVDSVQTNIDAFIRDGEPSSLIKAINTLVDQASGILLQWLPPQTAQEANKYLIAIADAVDAAGESWDAFARGETVEGIESAYKGLRIALDAVMPMHIRTDNVYNSIITTLDSVVGNLSETVLAYERRILESQVCWRKVNHREKQRPQKCVDDYIYDGQSMCYPRSALAQTGASRSLENATQGKGEAKPPVPAQCKDEYPDKYGHWCYKPCQSAFIDEDTTCKSKCMGNFSAETPAMCGRDPGILMKAITEMVTVVINSAFELAAHIIQMRENGVEPETLLATVNVFIDMGKPFANPICPVK